MSADDDTILSAPRPRVARLHSPARSAATRETITSRAGTRLGSRRVVRPDRPCVGSTGCRRTVNPRGSIFFAGTANAASACAEPRVYAQITTC